MARLDLQDYKTYWLYNFVYLQVDDRSERDYLEKVCDFCLICVDISPIRQIVMVSCINNPAYDLLYF